MNQYGALAQQHQKRWRPACQFAVDLVPSHSKWRHTWRSLIWHSARCRATRRTPPRRFGGCSLRATSASHRLTSHAARDFPARSPVDAETVRSTIERQAVNLLISFGVSLSAQADPYVKFLLCRMSG